MILTEVLVKVEHWGKQFPDEHRVAVYVTFDAAPEEPPSPTPGECTPAQPIHRLVGEVRVSLDSARLLRAIAERICPRDVLLFWAGVPLEPVELPHEARAALKLVPRVLKWMRPKRA